ncbi:phage antirepressor Ant [Arsenophonus endosymbiont of Aphis craccivora]|uniref:phage antirepressor Ant n=1 Tax=Arsenophonus endosymbiont of Aphis craccivora TaxID=1231049 RepID=UPI001EE22456|nr:phage antirepressor Ant [Arsenophonus endosymbiont of Aphis craccivora]
MSNLINVPNVTLSNNETVDSQQLLLMVNETRKEHGEPPIRNNKFIAKVKDELEGETYTKSVGQKNGADIEIIEMTLKQALRVAARESKAVRRSLIDKLEQQSKPQSANEIIAAMALANVAQERRLKSIDQVVQVSEEIEHIKQGTIPEGFQGYSYLKTKYGLSDAKCRQLVMAWNVPYKKVPHVSPGGQITQMSVVEEEAFKYALAKALLESEKRGSQWYHSKMGRFSVTA